LNPGTAQESARSSISAALRRTAGQVLAYENDKKFKRVIDASLLRQAYAVYGDDRYLQA